MAKKLSVGLLAMSGVRVRDEELLKLGLTLPGFVQRSKVIASLPSLGLLYLASLTPAPHTVRYFECASEDALPAEVFSCDVVAISTFSAQVLEAYSIATKLRQRGIITVIGGLHVSTLAEEAKQYVDHVVVGEGENVWPTLLAAIACGEPGRIWCAKEFLAVDVRTLPLPRYDLLEGRPYNRFTVQTSRGCPWRCEFCASTVMLQSPYRRRPVDAVIRDIKYLKRLFAQPFIEFADDNTFVDKKWGKELCRALITQRIKWFTETDISIADDHELLKLMRESGCRQVLVGLESPAADALKGIELRNDFKAKRAASYIEAIQRIQSYGITVNGCFILGLDHHTPEIFDEVLAYVKQLGLFEVQITVLTPFPGTPLYRRLEREGRLLYPQAWERCTLFDVNFQPKQMSPEQLRMGLHRLCSQLYSAQAVAARRAIFFANLRDRSGTFGLEMEGRACA